jgi:hypothetical protein
MFWGGVFGAAKSENNNRYGITYLRILVLYLRDLNSAASDDVR